MNTKYLPPSTLTGEPIRITSGVGRRRVIATLVFAASVVAAAAAQPGSTVKIMTQNLNPGTDLQYIVATGGSPDGVDMTRAEIIASNIASRADLIAARITAEQPDIVALQEAALWRTGATLATTTQVLFDPLPVLMQGLAARGVRYEVVAVCTLTDVALPGGTGEFLRYTDRDVMLIRAGLRPPAFHLSNVHARVFSAALDFNGLPVLQGWISAEVHLGNRHFRLIATHLQSPVAGMDVATEVQMAQAGELLREVRNVTVPVVLCGDFNSDAAGGNGPDATPTVGLITAAGYAECWNLVNPSAGNPGYTWPFYLQDQPPPNCFLPWEPFERIDLFFAKGIEVIGMNQVIAPAPAGTMPPYASDHAGVIASFRL